MLKGFRKIFSLRIKLLLSVVGVVLLFLSISTYFSIKQTGQIIQDQIESYGNSMSRAFADFCTEDLLAWNYPALQIYVDYVGEQDSQIKGIKIYHEEILVADYCSGKEDLTCDSDLAGVFKSPVVIDVQGEEQLLGRVEIYLSKEKYEEFLKAQMNLLWILSAILMLGDTFLSYWTVKILVLNPLRKIVDGTKAIGDGNLQHRIEVPGGDEIGVLAETINNMSKKLRVSYEGMAEQTDNLKEVRNVLMKTLEETKEAKEKVEDERNKTIAMISNLVDPVMVIDNNQRIMLANPSAKKILGVQDEDLNKELSAMVCEGPECESCVPQRLCLCEFKKIIRVPYTSHVLKTDEDNYPIVEELVIGETKSEKGQFVNDDRRVFKVLTSEVKDIHGKIYGRTKIFYDLTQEKIIDEMKSEFISIAAHQLRTPSSGVKWVLDMVLEGELGEIPPEAMKYIKRAAYSNELMVSLVKDLLNVSSMETGKFIYKFDRTNLQKILEDVVNSSNITAIQKDVQLSLEVKSDGIPEIMADPEKIRQAIQNLVNNAIKYSEAKDRIVVKLRTSEENPGLVEVTVEDDGIGINSNDLKKLFSKFYRGENARRLQTEGSGLGLFITKNIIDAHSGEISCKSIENEGTTFKVVLPVKQGN